MVTCFQNIFSLLQVFIILVKLLSCVQLFAIPWTIAYQFLHPWDFPGKGTGVSCHFLPQGIFPAQLSNPGLLLYHSHDFKSDDFPHHFQYMSNLLMYLSITNIYSTNLYYLNFFYYSRPTSV